MINIVWFKRDLRIYDNAALKQASISNNKVLPLYIIEPELWQQPVMSKRHYDFLRECLAELNTALTGLGQPLILKVGEVKKVFASLHHELGINAVWSQQETWNYWTYQRDLGIKRWFKEHNINWYEPSQNGVIRGLKDRAGWSRKWDYLMSKPIINPPTKLIKINHPSAALPSYQDLGLVDDNCPKRQTGGRTLALKLLKSFLHHRGENYSRQMSSPNTAFTSCSRLSPYLAFGTISLKEVYQKTTLRRKQIREQTKKSKWLGALRSFSARLHWHCHFIQKLEDEPRIEMKNMHSSYDGLREKEFNQNYFTSWKSAKTGYPMVDACMRALQQTGWINFRMRALLVSFASYHLWLHWKPLATYLATLFTDYEPGIHYSQIQMQSGTTGINSIRIYNPIKQGKDQDPQGIFIKKYIPQLKKIPIEYIHTPWEYPLIKLDYPPPIVDEASARKTAAAKIYAIRKQFNHRKEANQIIKKHGSRKSGLKNTTNFKKTKPLSSGQLNLFYE